MQQILQRARSWWQASPNQAQPVTQSIPQASVPGEVERTAAALADETRRLQLLYRLSHGLNGSLTASEVANQALEQTVKALNLYMGECVVIEPDGKQLHVIAVYGQPPEKVAEIDSKLNLRVGSGLAGAAAASRQLTIWTELGKNSKWYQTANVVVDVRAGAAVPLLVGDDLLGVLTLLSDRPDGFQEQDLQLLTALSVPVALALKNARRFEETRRRSAELESLTLLSAQLRAVKCPTQVMEIALNYCLRYFGAMAGDIYVPAPNDTLKIICHAGLPRSQTIEPIPIANSILGRDFRSATTSYIANMLVDPDFNPVNLKVLTTMLDHPEVVSAIHAPVRGGDEIIGVLSLLGTKPGCFGEDDLPMLAAFSEIAGNAVQRAQLFAAFEQQATERAQAVTATNQLMTDANQQLTETIQQLQEANRLLSQQDQQKDEFIAYLNHELRTQLTNIKLYLSLLADGKREEQRIRYLAVLQRETTQLIRLLDANFSSSSLSTTLPHSIGMIASLDPPNIPVHR